MGSEHRSPCKIICVMCSKSDETEITGPLGTKQEISAHENCLLFASGIYCKNSPTYDDLFGFLVKDVKRELQRGKKLSCHRCKKKGATVGCEEVRCRRSYHYPCAIEDHARATEDRAEGSFRVFCKLHDPQQDLSLPEASTSGLVVIHKRKPGMVDTSDSDSSTGSLELSFSKKKRMSQNDDGIEINANPEFALVELELEEECTSPNQHNQPPDPESERPCEKLPSDKAPQLGQEASTSAQKACGSTDNSGDLHDGRVLDSPVHSPEVDTPKRKKRKRLVFIDEETPPSADAAGAPVVSILDEPEVLKQPDQSTPVPEDTRHGEKLSPLITGADDDDDDDTDLDSQESQSLLQTETYEITVPCNVIVDSGPSESEKSADPCSPSGSAPLVMNTSPGSAILPEHKETPSTSRSSVMPRALTFDPVPQQEHVSHAPSEKPGSPQNSRPDFRSEQPPEASPPAGVSTSPDRPAAEDSCDGETMSSAATFWTRCNQAGWTKEIFSKLVCQLSSLGERVQSEEASPQDFKVALEVLEASGRLPSIITQLEQDLEKQEQELQRRKTALRVARTVLGDYHE